MNRGSIQLLRVVLALAVIFLAATASGFVAAIFHSQRGPIPGIAFFATALCLLILAQRAFPAVYPRHYRPRPWWQTRAAEGPFIIALGIAVSILSSRMATLWFGMLAVSGFLVALVLRLTNRGGEAQTLFADANAVVEKTLEPDDRLGSQPSPKSPVEKPINRSAMPTRSRGKLPFSIPDNYGIDVRNLAVASEWYREKLGLHVSQNGREDDSGRAFVDLHATENTFVSLVELPTGAVPDKRHVIFFATNLERAREWLAEGGILVDPITADSGGNRHFHFQDLEGNAIEICVEPR